MHDRDVFLDYIRGFAMILIVFIHTLNTTLGFSHYIVKSYFMIEMPLIFFVSGATNFLSNKTLIQFYKGRIFRVLIPYWAYAIICIVLSFIVSDVNFSYLIKWFFPVNGVKSNIQYLNIHLWFISVYVALIGLLPVYRYFFKRFNYGMLVLFWLGLALIDYFDADASPFLFLRPSYLLFYSFWLYLGFFYISTSKSLNKINIVILAISSFFITYFLINWFGYSIDMQINKFPPNLAFLSYTIGIFCVLLLLKNYILRFATNKPIHNVLLLFSHHSFSIYLYHVFGILLSHLLVRYLRLDEFIQTVPILSLMLFFAFNIVFCVLISKISITIKALINNDCKL